MKRSEMKSALADEIYDRSIYKREVCEDIAETQLKLIESAGIREAESYNDFAARFGARLREALRLGLE